MADTRELIVCEVLCFLQNKFWQGARKNIKAILINFYEDEEVSTAKDILYRCLEQLKIDGLPRLVKRKGDSKVKMDVEDILALWNFSDGKLELANLPKFVAANVDRIPSIKPEDLDIFILAQKVAAIEGQLKLQAIAADEATRKADLDVNNEVTSGKDEEAPAKPINTWAAAVGASLDKGSNQEPRSKVYQTKDNGSWVTVVKKRSTPAQPQQRIVWKGGTKTIKALSTEKKLWHLFVGCLSPETTVDNLAKHLEDNGISVVSCRMLERKEKWQE